MAVSARWRRRWGWEARSPRPATVVQGCEVSHADGEIVRNFKGLSETRSMGDVTSRLSAYVELGGE